LPYGETALHMYYGRYNATKYESLVFEVINGDGNDEPHGNH